MLQVDEINPTLCPVCNQAPLFCYCSKAESEPSWNQKIRDSVDSLLAQRGYAEDSSARHQLACMNFTTPQTCQRCSELEEEAQKARTQEVTDLNNALNKTALLHELQAKVASLTQERDEWKDSALNGGNAGYLRQELTHANAVIEKCKEALIVANVYHSLKLHEVSVNPVCEKAFAAISEYQKGGE